MNQNKAFYIYLSSNQSETFNISCFTINLPHPIHFSTEFEVALVKTIIPVTWYNLKEEAEVKFEVGPTAGIKRVSIQPGLYQSPKDLVDKINNGILQVLDKSPPIPAFGVPSLQYNSTEHKCKLNFPMLSETDFWTFDLSSNLEKILGLKSRSKLTQDRPEVKTDNIVDFSGDVHLITISCNLIEESIVDSTHEPILDTVSPPDPTTKLFYGTAISKTFFPRRYHRLNPTSYKDIKSITIKIKDISGSEINFIGGTASVWLHFRPVMNDGSLLY